MKHLSKQMAKLAAYSESYMVALDSIVEHLSHLYVHYLRNEWFSRGDQNFVASPFSILDDLAHIPQCMHIKMEQTVAYCIISPPGKADWIQYRQLTFLTPSSSTREMSVTLSVVQHAHCELSVEVPLNSVEVESNQIFLWYWQPFTVLKHTS